MLDNIPCFVLALHFFTLPIRLSKAEEGLSAQGVFELAAIRTADLEPLKLEVEWFLMHRNQQTQ
jgi:hypothetical protein